MTYPLGEDPEDQDTVVLGRMANIIIPFTLMENGHTCRIHMIMPEADARAIMNMSDDQAGPLGVFFGAIKQYLTEFIHQEG